MKYDILSSKAEEFINHGEILDSLKEAEENKNNVGLQEQILKKARLHKGLSHREAAMLLFSTSPMIKQEIKSLAKEIKEKFYGNRIVLFAPLYLSNYCVNNCIYCPYHQKNKDISRLKLSQEQIYNEVVALQDMGHKRLAIELGEDPVHNPLDYVLESIDTIYSVKNKNGSIRRVNVNIAATSVENYKKLKEAQIGTYILFQETYHKENYQELHPGGPKSDYAYHTEAMDRAMDGGIDDVGIGVLFGLNNYPYDFVGLLMHAEHLEAAKGCGPHTISVPRICPADDIDPGEFSNAVPDHIFTDLIALIRISVPYTGMIISTRESKEIREKALSLGVSQISGGSKTSVGGYIKEEEDSNSAQFDTSDKRSLDEVIKWLLEIGELPSFCTACYGMGRTGEDFMDLVKEGKIAENCQSNALLTLSEYLEDYASEETREIGQEVLKQELNTWVGQERKAKISDFLEEIQKGKRNLRF